MSAPAWVQRDVVLAFHDRLLAEHGGSPGVRDVGMLESALGRPQNLYAYSRPSLPELAAAYAFGLVKNHPFLDGNKRIAFVTAVLFLELNELRFEASEVEAVDQTLALAAGETTELAYGQWLQSNAFRSR